MQILLPEIEAMIAKGKTQREVAEHFGLKDKVNELQNARDAGILQKNDTSWTLNILFYGDR